MKQFVAFLVLAACGGASPPATSTISSPGGLPTVAPTFQPTAFGVEISGQGRPVILIPGLGCPGSVWKDTVAHLGPTVQAHVLTLSGFAGRPPIDKPLVATTRSELAAYIRDRHLDHPVVIGHSLGGLLAYWLAATEPDLVGPLVAVDAIPAIGAMPGGVEGAAKRRDSWKQMSPQEFGAAIRQFFGTMTSDPSRLEPLLAEIVRSDQRTVGDAFHELFTIDPRPELPRITAPLLAIVADSPYQKFIAEQLAAVPHLEVTAVPHTKHMVMYDDPAGFYRVLDGFLAAHPGP
jgi:N-formylmaleamate deformylase